MRDCRRRLPGQKRSLRPYLRQLLAEHEGCRFALGPLGLFGWRVTRAGWPFAAWHARLPGVRGAELRELITHGVNAMLKKPDARKVSGGVQPLKPDPGFAKRFPNLWEYLSATKYEDGTDRETSSVLLFQDGGVWKAMLRDKSAGLCLWVACSYPSLLWEALETALGDPDVEWRVDRQAAGQTAKRVKRGG